MTWHAPFHRRPRCMECRTTEHLHQVEDGLHKGYVCVACAITTGYIQFLPELATALGLVPAPAQPAPTVQS